MAYTEIHQLPPPPQFMLDELEREESKYLGELLSKVLTIREARPIKMALMQKLQVHPIVNAVRDSAEKVLREREEANYRRGVHSSNQWKNKSAYDGSVSWKKMFTGLCPKINWNIIARNSIRDKNNCHIMNGQLLRFKSGKKKGEISPKKYRIADHIIHMWYKTIAKYGIYQYPSDIDANYFNPKLKYYEEMYEKYLRLGFNKYFEINFNKWKNMPESHIIFDFDDYNIWQDEYN